MFIVTGDIIFVILADMYQFSTGSSQQDCAEFWNEVKGVLKGRRRTL